MTIKWYNTEKRTETYLNQLEKWIKKIDKYKYHNKSLIDDEWLRKLKMFPINRRGDILLIIKPKWFAYHLLGQRGRGYVIDNNLKGKTCKVIDLFDNTTGYDHGPPDGDYDLEVRISQDGIKYINPHFVAYATNFLPPYVFLPFPERLKDFSRFLPFFAKKPERLERILDDYYKSLPHDSSFYKKEAKIASPRNSKILL